MFFDVKHIGNLGAVHAVLGFVNEKIDFTLFYNWERNKKKKKCNNEKLQIV